MARRVSNSVRPQGFKYRAWGDPKLWEAGYTRDYLNPTMLDLPIATVTDRRLAERGPAYKALIIDAEQGPPTDPVKTSMPVEVARKILGYARAGLPIIVVGSPPDRTPGNTPHDDPTLRSVIAELLRERRGEARRGYPKNFGVGIRARIRSSSSGVTRLMPFLRQVSSTALTTIPRTNAGILFMRSEAVSSHAIVAGESIPYSRRPDTAGAAAEPCRVRSGDPTNFPGVWVQRGSSAIRSPVIP